MEPTAPLATTTSGVGPRVVLVHGFTQTAASWRHVARLLDGRYSVVRVDLPGHGGSSARRVAGLSEAGRLVGAVGGRAAYVGYSLGGRTCLTLALEHPELVERLVLVGATAGIEDPAERAARRAADEALAARLDPAGGEPAETSPAETSPAEAGSAPLPVPEFLAEWLSGPLFAHLDAEQADVASRLANTGAGLASSLRSTGTGTQVPSWGELAQLAMPVLLVTGERDEKFAALARRMAATIGPNATHLLVPGAGHAAPFEAPEAFAALVADALA